MNICIVAATEFELNHLSNFDINSSHKISLHVHGVGMMAACFHIQKIAFQKPDLIIQCGIAGAFHKNLELGQTIVVSKELLGDMGAEDHEQIINVFDLGIVNKSEFPFENGCLVNPKVNEIQWLQHASGITVNMCSGKNSTIAHRKQFFNADVESMEGAALHYVCLQEGIPFLQFRSVSNYIEPRNKNLWKLDEAMLNCQLEVVKYVQHLNNNQL